MKARKKQPARSTKRIYYDTETSGLSHPFDQILQICLAYVCDDYNITNILLKRCKRLPWVVPSPSAMLVTGIDGQMMEEQGEPYYKVMKEIQDWIEPKMPRITFVGHNIIGFDESVLRHAFHQTLLNPYVTSSKGCGRFDTMSTAIAISVYAAGAMSVKNPEDPNKTSFKLGDLLQMNGIPFDKSAAHDAIVDVRGTIELDKFMAKAAPAVYEQMERNSTKGGVREFVSQSKHFSYTVAYFGVAKTFSVAPIPKNFTFELKGSDVKKGDKMTKEQIRHFRERQRHDHRQIIFDLSFDPEPYMNMSLEEIIALMPDSQRALPSRKKTPSPFKYFRDNTQPIVMPHEMTPPELVKIPEDELKRRAEMVAKNREFHAKLTQALMLSTPPQVESEFIEEQIYDTFPSEGLKKWCDRFHASDWEKRMDMVKNFKKDFAKELREDPSLIRYKGFAKRIIFAEAPRDLLERDVFWKKLLKPFQDDMLKRIAAPDVIQTARGNKVMTVGGALQEIIKIMDKVEKGDTRFGDSEEVREELRDIADYLKSLLPPPPEPKQAPKPKRAVNDNKATDVRSRNAATKTKTKTKTKTTRARAKKASPAPR